MAIPANFLLARLDQDVYDRIARHLKPVSLKRGQILHRPGELIRDLYFPTTCMISITVRTKNGRTVETGVAGRREVAGINAFMGGRETTDTAYVVQIPGDAMRIKAAPMKAEFGRNTQMRNLMLKYTQALIAQISQNVACNRLHTIDQRCARWLLEVRDRMDSDTFQLTHVFIAEMLGVRRVGVTQAQSKLKRKGIIEYRRGNIVILDMAALEAASCECHALLKREYFRLLGAKPKVRIRDQG